MAHSGPWAYMIILFVGNLVQSLATGGTVSIMTMVELGVMVLGLVTYVGLIGSTGSDPLSAAAAAIAIARAVALTLFVGSIIAIVVTSFVTLGSPLIAFIDIAIGGFAVFGAIGAAKPGAT